ncbi:MAG: glycosyltransferase [Eubacterium sp.]|nr:glycosyltransferase [Eubacterium sp.]
MNNCPKISIIMGIYTSKKKDMVKQAIQSIIDQTFTEWEFVICDDGSPDDTWEFLNKEYGYDPRFVLIRNEQNGGLRVALNTCLAASRADYVVRQDADDFSRKDRLEILYNYVLEHPEYDVVGTAMVSFDENGEFGIVHPRKEYPKKIDFIHGTVVAHASTIMKKESLSVVNGYRVAWETTRCEDTDLYMRMCANGAKFYNLDEGLYYVRQDREAYARKKYINRVKEATVKLKGFKTLKMPLWTYIFVLKPLIVGLIPQQLMRIIKKKMSK